MSSSNKKVRVRFAPSPTGYLHVGGARTALYNWLFARKMKGDFILRIEDTDKARSTQDATQAILDGLEWLGMDWDEGPFYQTERLDIYREYAQKLLEEGKAYYCFCTGEELAAQRKEAREKKEAPRYNGKCRKLTADEQKKLIAGGKPAVLRFKTPVEGTTIVDDLIRGPVKFENGLLDDFVILKTDTFPTYNFAAVIDDHLMEITHVIRGDDHLSNTPRQILMYRALGFDLPKFAHIPMILGKDKARMSKRHGATSVIDYKGLGYLPEAMINYLARLGWGHADQEIFSREELIDLFTLEKVNKTSAVFDTDKLDWLNAHYIRQSLPERLMDLTRPFLEKAYPSYTELSKTKGGIDHIRKIIVCLQDRMKTVNEVVALSDFFFSDELKFDPAAVQKHLKEEGVADILSRLKEGLSKVSPFTKDNIEPVFRNLAKELGVKAGKVIHPARVALTGRSDSPPMFDTVEIIGKETSIKRLEAALAK
ncbi:MAG: glutamate--tRNA ligase [Candidatus Saganbacteria bacterium]|nr:glutamate--tRNA ligase [Candidatus Saganbacteria bacterium]